MKGIILAGGTGSRLFPLTKVTNKHLLPVGRYPMIVHPVMKLRQAGILDILIVTGREHMGDMIELLGSGTAFGVEFTYRVQDEAGGIAQALGLAHPFVGQDQMCVILGDNIFSDALTPYLDKYRYEHNGEGAMVLLKEVPDPHRFGVVEIENGIISTIVEKPKEPKSNLAVVGVYVYDCRVFEIIQTLKPSGRGELEITDVNSAYLKDSKLHYGLLEGWWTDAGTFESYPAANELAAEVNWNLPDLIPAPSPLPPTRPGFIDPYQRVGWPPRYPGYFPMQPPAAAAQPAAADAGPGAFTPPPSMPMTEEEKKIARRKLEREAGMISMPKHKASPKDPFPHDFDDEHAPIGMPTADTPAAEMKDMADLIFTAQEADAAARPEITRPDLYKKTCETLPDSNNTIYTTDGTRSNNWVPVRWYDYVHFPERVYQINYDKFEHKLALATQIDRAIMSIEGVTRHYPEGDDRHIRVGYYFMHKEREFMLACITLGDSIPPQPHVLVWIKIDIYQDIEDVGFKVTKFRFDNEEARFVYVDSLEQLQGLVDVLVRKINLRRGVKEKATAPKTEKRDEEKGTGGRSF